MDGDQPENNDPSSYETNKFDGKDYALFKDLAEVSRARNSFFVPFSGAFLALLFADHQSVADAGPVVQIIVAVTFLMGVFYSTVLSSYYEKLEAIRFMSTVYLHPVLGSSLPDRQKVREALTNDLNSLSSHGHLERRIFKWTMYMLWMSACTMLIRIYFETFLKFWLEWSVYGRPLTGLSIAVTIPASSIFQRFFGSDPMKSPLRYKSPNYEYWTVKIPTLLFNFLQWLAVTSLIIYAGRRSHSLFLEIFGGFLEGLLFIYATELTIDRIDFPFLDER